MTLHSSIWALYATVADMQDHMAVAASRPYPKKSCLRRQLGRQAC